MLASPVARDDTMRSRRASAARYHGRHIFTLGGPHMHKLLVPMSVAVACLVMNAAARAQPLAEHVPADARVYVAWRGIDDIGAAYQGSHLQGVVSTPRVKELLDETIPSLLKAQAEQDPKAGDLLAFWNEVSPALWSRPWAVYLEPSAPGASYQPGAGLVIDAGPHADAVRRWMQRAVQEAPSWAGSPQAQLTEAGSVLSLRIVRGDRPAGALGLDDADGLESALAQVMPEAAFLAYADVAAFVADAVRAGDASMPQPQREAAARVRKTLGLETLEQAIYAGGFNGKDWQSQAFLGASDTESGLIGALSGEPLTDAELSVVPRTATWVWATRFDPAKVYTLAREAMESADEEVILGFDNALLETSTRLGVDIEADVIQSLGDTWVLYSDPAVVGPFGLGAVLVAELDDAPAAAKAFATLEGHANTMMERQGQGVRFKTNESGGITIHSLATPMVAPSWAVHQGKLFVALSPQAIVTATVYAGQQNNSIVQNEKFQAVRQALGGRAGSTLMFVDLPQTAPMAYQQYLMLTQMLASVTPGDTGAAMLLPPLAEILPHLAPAGEVSWLDDDGWHLLARSPFPGSTLLSQQALFSGGPFGALSAGIALPAIARARDSARATASMSNLRQIAVAFHMFASEHGGETPNHLVELRRYVNNNLDVFLNPGAGVAAPDTTGWTDDAMRGWLDEHASYVYLKPGGKLNEIANPATAPLFVEKPAFAENGTVAVAYADGHAERRPVAEAEALLAAQAAEPTEAPAAP